MADPAKATVARRDVGIEHGIEMRRITQVGVGDDAPHHLTSATFGFACDEHGLSHRRERSVGAAVVRRPTFDEDRVDHVVSAAEVCLEVGESVRHRPSRRPQMVVGVDDRRVGVDDRLDQRVEPFLRGGFVTRCSGHHRMVRKRCNRATVGASVTGVQVSNATLRLPIVVRHAASKLSRRPSILPG